MIHLILVPVPGVIGPSLVLPSSAPIFEELSRPAPEAYELDERSVEVVGTEAHDGWYKNTVLALDDGWASVGPEGNMQYPLGPDCWPYGTEAKREQVHFLHQRSH